ncbi:MAG: tripartite tricarboxylate transporter substrate binding protein [Burkholderiales bacterium]|nr:tripartite tricarboxylate transporter substrate binding protein [Burkholderiales bacterium]
MKAIRIGLIGAAAVSLLLAFTTTALAQAFPSKPIRLIVPFSAGGGTDTVARIFAENMSKHVGQPVVVDNRPGATGVIGLDALVASPPDGYTMLMFNSTTATAHLFQNKPFDVRKLMVPVGNIMTAPMLLAVNPSVVSVKTLPELIAYFKAHPGTDYTTSGAGSPGELSIAALAREMNFRVTHVPYKGIAPAIQGVLGGQVGVIILDATTAKPHVLAGKILPLVVLSSKRIPYMANVATSAEQGMSNLSVEVLGGLVVPVGTPSNVVAVLRKAIRETVQSKEYRNPILDAGMFPDFIDETEWTRRNQHEYDYWKKFIKETGMKFE